METTVPKFCRYCGLQLISKEEPRYNAYSGNPQPIQYLECPSRGKVGTFSGGWYLERGHDKYKWVQADPDWGYWCLE